ncbi:MAG: CotH kinase family protein [Reichenbachiella sp.]
MPKILLLVLSFFLGSFLSIAQVNHWESVILEDAEWQYTVPTSQPDAQWIDLAFDDSLWGTGNAGFGYSDDDDNTVLPDPTTSVYLRKNFSIVDLAAINLVYLHMDYDDGFVAYLNGIEIARDQMSGNPPLFDQFSDGLHESLLYQGIAPERFEIDVSLLVEGNNILAVEVHNESTTSSDLSAIPILSLGINDDSNNYSPTPQWFSAPVDLEFISTNLPIIMITTEGGTAIQDDPKVSAEMKIVYRGEGERTFLTDENDVAFLDYSGNIKIEFRGSSSQSLPKKQYGFTTYDVTGLFTDNVSLLGMPKENDWILNGLAFDPSLIRDYFSYNLAREMGEYASRTQYCEVLINGSYSGLYVLQEKLKADDNRIDINKIDAVDNTLPQLSGGYITKADKTTGNDPVAWVMPNYSGWETAFIHATPKPEEATSAQTAYIQSEFEKLSNTSLAGNASFSNGYPSVIDIPSFVNFMLLNELASNVDAYQFSTYFHKDRNGKLRAGPVWDLNLSFGNDLFDWGFDRSHTDIWQFENENRGATFWTDLYESNDFRCYLSKRWNELTQPNQPMNLSMLEASIDETVELISEATEREQALWGTVENHTEEISNMKSWIATRIEWMNQEIGSFDACSNVTTPNLVISKIHYHPAPGVADDSDYEFIELHNNGNTTVDLTGVYFGSTGFVYQFPIDASIEADERIILANDTDIFSEYYGVPPYAEFSRSLSNGSQTLSLLDGFGNLIDEVSYSDESPWPVEADGDGFHLELVDSDLDNNDPSNWVAKIPDFGSPTDVLSSSDSADEIILYPNPTNSIINIRGAVTIQEITITNIEGEIIYEERPNSMNHNIDLSDRSNGLYFIRIKQGDKVVVKKILVK